MVPITHYLIRPGDWIKHNVSRNTYFVISCDTSHKLYTNVYLLSTCFIGWWSIKEDSAWTQVFDYKTDR